MAPAAKIGRNDSCPCGSGRKYKHCCETKKGQLSRSATLIAAALAAALALAVVGAIVSNWNDPGAAAPRQVWSPEHGHYHTVP